MNDQSTDVEPLLAVNSKPGHNQFNLPKTPFKDQLHFRSEPSSSNTGSSFPLKTTAPSTTVPDCSRGHLLQTGLSTSAITQNDSSSSPYPRYLDTPVKLPMTTSIPQREQKQSSPFASTASNPFQIRQPLVEERWNQGSVAEIRCTICKRYIRDDVVHFMMECPKFWKERSEYLTILSHLDVNLVAPTLGPDDR